MRIAMFVPDLRGGGAERVCLLLMSELLAKGHDVELLLLREEGVLLERVPDEVRTIDFRANRVRQGFWPLLRYLRETPPDALLVSMWPLTTVAVLAAKLACFRGQVVASEHSTLSRSPQNDGISGFALRSSMRWVNSLADEVVGVSAGVVEDLHGLGLPSTMGRVIHNPVDIGNEGSVQGEWLEHPWMRCPRSLRLLAVGSPKPAKDYPTLLLAVKKLVDSGKNVSLLVLGSGPLLGELEKQLITLGLEHHVHFGGFVSEPGPFYRSAGLFILSSAWEGFGNVIVESLAAGTPVVSTNCRSGPAEILENGRYGRLVPVGDHEALAKAIRDSLDATHDRDALRTRAADFSVERITEEYLEILT